MAFQDRAESLAEKLHLGRVPRSVFVAVALALVLMIVLAGYAFCASLSGGFEVRAQDAASKARRVTPRRPRRAKASRTWCSPRAAMGRGSCAFTSTGAWHRPASTICPQAAG